MYIREHIAKSSLTQFCDIHSRMRFVGLQSILQSTTTNRSIIVQSPSIAKLDDNAGSDQSERVLRCSLAAAP